jgi:hypothetical protein
MEVVRQSSPDRGASNSRTTALRLFLRLFFVVHAQVAPERTAFAACGTVFVFDLFGTAATQVAAPLSSVHHREVTRKHLFKKFSLGVLNSLKKVQIVRFQSAFKLRSAVAL